jgi:integrase/recombinase XerD
LKAYLLQREARLPGSACDRLFVGDRGAAPAYSTVRQTFRHLTRTIPTHPGSTRRSRLHDLRHTFACERLTRWYREGADVTHAVAALSTYLGHAKPSDTCWYLSVTPELMAEVSSRFEQFRTERRAT